MKKIFIILTLFFITSINNAHAILPIGGYVGARGGISLKNQDKNLNNVKIDSTSNPSIGINAGVRFLRLRGELEYLYRYKNQNLKSFNGSTSQLNSNSLMGNLYYNVFDVPFVKIFVNGGVGYTSFNSNIPSNTNGNFTYNLGLGTTLSLADVISVDAGYRYFDMGDIKIGTRQSHIYANDIYVGLRFGF